MGRVAGTEVGRCPWCARARCLVGPGASGAPSIVPGADRPRSTPARVPPKGRPTPAARRRSEPWKSSIRVAPAWTCTRTRWWPARALPRDATSRWRCGPSRPPRPGCWRCPPGWPSAAAPTWPWRPRGSTGSRCGHGGHGGLLEAGLAHPVRRRLHPGAGERGAREERAGPQDRRGRRDLAGRAARPRADPAELRARARDPSAARPAAHPQAAGPRACEPRPAPAEDARGREPQARLGAHRHHRDERAGSGAVPRTLEALIAGESDPARLAALANRLVKAAPEKLREALRGRVTPQHRFLLRLHLRQIEALEAAVGDIDREAEAGPRPLS